MLDVSATALERAKARLPAAAVTWIEADVTGAWSAPQAEIWHDRAVFHFLTDAADRAAYVQRLRRTLRPGGFAIIGTFALEGPPRCSGLPVVRYSPASLGAELGAGFEIAECIYEQHRTPAGHAQAFCWCRFLFRGSTDR